MDPDKRFSTNEISADIEKIDVSSMPSARRALRTFALAFEQLLTSEFKVDADQYRAYEALCKKIDVSVEFVSSDKMLALANRFADKINSIDVTIGLATLATATAFGCEFTMDHMNVILTRDAPTLEKVDIRRAHDVLKAHVFRPAKTDFRSPTDRVPGNDRGFHRGQTIAHAI